MRYVNSKNTRYKLLMTKKDCVDFIIKWYPEIINIRWMTDEKKFGPLKNTSKIYVYKLMHEMKQDIKYQYNIEHIKPIKIIINTTIHRIKLFFTMFCRWKRRVKMPNAGIVLKMQNELDKAYKEGKTYKELENIMKKYGLED